MANQDGKDNLEEGPLLYEVHGHVGVITLNRPEAMNSLTYESYALLEDTVRNSTARALIITANGRAFCAGDDVKHLDWKVYYRHEKHMIKQYEMETNLVCHLMLDVSASMRYGESDEQKLLYASRLATTLGYLVVEQSDKVSFATFDESVRDTLKPSNAMGQILRMTETLDQIKPVKKTQMSGPLLDLAGRS